MRLMDLWIVLVLSFMVAGCELLGTDRSFLTDMEYRPEGFFEPHKDFPVVAGDEGQAYRSKEEILDRTPRERAEEQPINGPVNSDQFVEDELERLEELLPDREYQHYRKYARYLPSTSEKIFFLRLPSVAARNDYLQSRGMLKNNRNDYSAEMALAIRNRELVLGMSKEAVMKSWGRPERIDVAGDPKYENERWLFLLEGRPKYVFFEQGIVKGWLSDQ